MPSLSWKQRIFSPIESKKAVWAASVSFSADGAPVCEEVRDGVFAVGAYSGTGNVIGAICGRAAAAWAVARLCPV